MWARSKHPVPVQRTLRLCGEPTAEEICGRTLNKGATERCLQDLVQNTRTTQRVNPTTQGRDVGADLSIWTHACWEV